MKDAVKRLKENQTLDRQKGPGRPACKSTGEHVDKVRNVFAENPQAAAGDVMRETGKPPTVEISDLARFAAVGSRVDGIRRAGDLWFYCVVVFTLRSEALGGQEDHQG